MGGGGVGEGEWEKRGERASVHDALECQSVFLVCSLKPIALLKSSHLVWVFCRSFSLLWWE